MNYLLWQMIAALPMLVIVWGITYWLMIYRHKIEVSGLMIFINFFVIDFALAIVFTPGTPSKDDNGVAMLVVTIIVSMCSCAWLRSGKMKSGEE